MVGVAGCTWLRPSSALEREALAKELDWDPLVELAAIGSAASKEGAKVLASQFRDTMTGQQELRALRFGLGHDDERVVFGAVVLLRERQLPVPELKNAAAVVLPRLADDDCPVTTDQAELLIGSGDFAALVPVIPRLPERTAVWFLHELHREVRPDAVPALCAIAKATEGAVRRAAFGNVVMSVNYSQRNVELVVSTWLELIEQPIDARREPVGLPAVLRAALQASLAVEEEPRPDEGELDARSPSFPVVPCARWLLASQPSAHDVPLLRELIGGPDYELRTAAVEMLGAVDDASARAVLHQPQPDGVGRLAWLAARAQQGDEQALEELLTERQEGLVLGLLHAPPKRRAAFLADVLAGPLEEALEVVGCLGWWAKGQLGETFLPPPYDEEVLRELEPMLAQRHDLDCQLLRACVDQLPCCETVRLADALLRFPAEQLLGGDARESGHHTCGHAGVWAFLEVTRPQELRCRLREGLDCDDEEVRSQAAELLVALGDAARLAQLSAWIDQSAYADTWWPLLARSRSAELIALLRQRIDSTEVGERERSTWMAGLAVALGVPRAALGGWSFDESVEAATVSALFSGDAVRACLLQLGEHDLNARTALALRDWGRALVVQRLDEWRLHQEVGSEFLYLLDQVATVASGNRAAIQHLMQPVHDGRYATHYYFSPEVAVRAGGLEMLPFWIDELGSNCCKASFIEEVFQQLFRWHGNTGTYSQYREPTSVALRRTLLPVAHRLRFSRIADGFVVAGN